MLEIIQNQWGQSHNLKSMGCAAELRSVIPAGVNPALVRQVSHQIVSIGQAELTPNVKHDGRKPAGRKRKLK